MLAMYLEKSHNNLQEESCKVSEEKNSLMRRFLDLGEEKSNLEEDISVLIHDTIAQSNMSLIYQNIIFEKLLELNELCENHDKLVAVNNDLEGRLNITVHKLENAEMENSHLRESFVKSNVELALVESVNDQLSCQIRNEKEILSQKEIELLEAAETLRALHTEKTELQIMVEDLKIKYDEARGILEEQANQILKLSSDKDHQNEELGYLCEVNQKLESEMKHVHQELGETKLREKNLSYDVHKRTDEIEQWETQASTLYAELQTSSVNEALFEGKVCELADACDNLERRNYSKDMESEQLKERICKLEGENGRLCDQLAAYVPAVNALNDCVTSLEMQTLVHAKPHDYKESEVKDLVNHQYTESGRQTGEDQTVMAPDALPDFQDMQRRINAIAMAVNQTSLKRNDEMREIQELKSRISWHEENIQASKHATQVDEVKEHQHEPTNEQKMGKSSLDVPAEEIEVLPKDIMLDQISECLSFGISRSETLEADDQMLELWETSDKDGIISQQVDKTQKMAAGPADYHKRDKYPSTESLVEKELSVDKLEISRRMTQPHEAGNKSKILERLHSDAQKLSNLQITLQDLMKKVESTEKNRKGKSVEYDSVKGQLEAAQDAVTKLFDDNLKLMKNVEEGTLSSDGKAAAESDESESVSRRRLSEPARRGSEKIGQLQLEVQMLQFVLLKLEDGKESKEKTRMGDRSPRVLLRDYLYGGTRTNNQKKKKKAPLCACIQPPTKGD